MEPLYELGADDVIPEDYEASVEVLVRVSAKYLVPRSDIERLVTQLRTEHYRMLRTLSFPSAGFPDLELQIPTWKQCHLGFFPIRRQPGNRLGTND